MAEVQGSGIGADAARPRGRTGRGVRIGVIDSGVHPDHPHILSARLSGGVAVERDGQCLPDMPGLWFDRLGHGTAVTAAIQEKAPDAEILSVRVFREALRTTAAALVAAIDWCVERQVDIVNLSLGSTTAAHRAAFAGAVARADAAGVAVVAARAADGVPCLPGALPGVIGVGVDWECPRDRYRLGAEGFAASGYPRPIPGVALRRNLYGISFAVAQMTGFAAQACEAMGADDAQGRAGRVRRWLEAAAQAGGEGGPSGPFPPDPVADAASTRAR